MPTTIVKFIDWACQDVESRCENTELSEQIMDMQVQLVKGPAVGITVDD